MNGNGPDNEDYYPTIVINILLNSILRDNSLSQHHPMVIDAIVSIFPTLYGVCICMYTYLHAYYILTVCDYQNILTDMTIGNTRTITGIYMIIAALRELAKWIGSHFRDWISLLFTPPTVTDGSGSVM